MNETTNSRLYFPGLNGLRFVAAFMVMVSHIEQLKKDENLANLDHLPIIGQSGQNGVSLFFVLSGFLITYLLLQEDKETGTINIRKFYIRRILRIWPLYYLIVGLGFFVLPWCLEASGLQNALITAYWPKLILFLLFLPNLAMVAFPQVPFTAQVWSIGTEEQFYLIWPFILKKFKAVLPAVLTGIAVGIILLRKSLFILRDHLAESAFRSGLSLFVEFLNTFNIECMAIGGLGAWLLFHDKTKILNVIYKPLVQVLLLCGIFASLSTGLFGHVKFRHVVNSLLFIGLILNLAGNPNSLLRLENNFYRFMGRISYGLYMFHPLCFYLVFYACKPYLYQGPLMAVNILIYVLVFALSTGIAWLSYTLFEKRFLKMKPKYSLIESGEASQ
ncbi:MAG TPA: acyltransferase [Bacteroidia bacterium]|jgi:peptidoglycan/LPS O-acetylase OafA/YrhL|nr:acyltransferase [Bacteroidia bacterium]